MGSIPVRVTTSIAHIWLNKADCELFFLLKIRLVRCLSAILIFYASSFLLSRNSNAPSIASDTLACAFWN